MKKAITLLAIGGMLITFSCQKQIDKPADLKQSSQKNEFSLEAYKAKTEAYIKEKVENLNKLSDRLSEEGKTRSETFRKPPTIINFPINVPDIYTTIQDAVDNAPDGTTINVTGNYTENVFIYGRNNITIDGGGSATLSPSSEFAYTFGITNSSNIIIKGFIIHDGPVVVQASQQIEISNNYMSGMGDGIQLLESNNCFVQQNTLSDNYYDGQNNLGGEGNGIVLLNSNYTTINNNLTENNEARGILLISSSDNTVNSNHSTNDGLDGIGIFSNSHNLNIVDVSNSNTLEMNEINGSGIGVYILGNANDNILKDNHSHNNKYGIVLDGDNEIPTRTKISSCDFSNNGATGVLIGSNAKDNTILSTTALNNSMFGFELATSSVSNTIRNCTATGNGQCDYWDQGTKNASTKNTFGNICN